MISQASLLPEPPGRYVSVGVPVPIPGTFSYRVPEMLDGFVDPGSRVRVRFAGRRLTGVVVQGSDAPPEDTDASRIRWLDDALDRQPPLSDLMLRLAARLADAYLVGIGEVLQLALPSGRDPAAARRVRLRDADKAAAAAGLSQSERRVLAAMASSKAAGCWSSLASVLRVAGCRHPYAAGNRLAASGLVQLRDEWGGGSAGRTRALMSPRSGMTLEAALDRVARAPAQQRAVRALWAADSPCLVADLADRAEVSVSTLRQLERHGLVERHEVAVERPVEWQLGDDGAGSFALTASQDRALERVTHALGAARPRPLLLHGVTGSGKTEVYLRAALQVLAQGRTALLLVPEIGLTPQLEQRARAVLGDAVAVLHSGLASGERQRAWWRARRGEASVVLGPRSAVFAPLGNVGLVVVDEEQDSAYKQEERPRYNGRDVALWRAELEEAVVILGSATPSAESYRLAVTDDYELARLPRRVAARPMPRVDLVDMRQEWREAGRGLVSRELEKRLADRLRKGEQTLLLLNRRGYASALVCRSCGARAECPHCAVSLTLHRQDHTLRCHYCDHREPVAALCSQCGADSLHDLGHGTERLQAALAGRYPDARVERFDADQTQRRGSHARILSRFGAGEIDILVGTQMLAKGHDFPGVTLVGVVGADASLGVPDFRAAERTFQLLTQMAGRAGRGDVAGEVVLQAHQPGHYAIDAAIQHDYEGFFEREIAYRRRLVYPPFVELAVCVCRGKLAPVVKEEADWLAGALRRAATDDTVVLGPATPPLGRLRGRYRMQLMVKASARRELLGTLRRGLSDLRASRRMPRDLVIDIDPRNLM